MLHLLARTLYTSRDKACSGAGPRPMWRVREAGLTMLMELVMGVLLHAWQAAGTLAQARRDDGRRRAQTGTLTDATIGDAVQACLAADPVYGECPGSAYGPISGWDVSAVTDMTYMRAWLAAVARCAQSSRRV